MQFKKISLRSTELRSGEVQRQVLGLLKLAKIYDKEIEQLQKEYDDAESYSSSDTTSGYNPDDDEKFKPLSNINRDLTVFDMFKRLISVQKKLSENLKRKILTDDLYKSDRDNYWEIRDELLEKPEFDIQTIKKVNEILDLETIDLNDYLTERIEKGFECNGKVEKECLNHLISKMFLRANIIEKVKNILNLDRIDFKQYEFLRYVFSEQEEIMNLTDDEKNGIAERLKSLIETFETIHDSGTNEFESILKRLKPNQDQLTELLSEAISKGKTNLAQSLFGRGAKLYDINISQCEIKWENFSDIEFSKEYFKEKIKEEVDQWIKVKEGTQSSLSLTNFGICLKRLIDLFGAQTVRDSLSTDQKNTLFNTIIFQQNATLSDVKQIIALASKQELASYNRCQRGVITKKLAIPFPKLCEKREAIITRIQEAARFEEQVLVKGCLVDNTVNLPVGGGGGGGGRA